MSRFRTSLKKIFSSVRSVWLALGISLLLLLIAELIASAVLCVMNPQSVENEVSVLPVDRDTFRETAWLDDYCLEFQKAKRVRWEPYVYWRKKPFEGRYIHIDEKGMRVTPQPLKRVDKDHRSIKIFIFGGSTLWGTGSRDDHTIPALLTQKLHAQGISSSVTNFGETGYVNTQEVITLFLELQKGNKPDIVIFYDGANDTFSAYQNRRAGIPINEINRIQEFNLTQPEKTGRLTRLAVKNRLAKMSLVRLFRAMIGSSTWRRVIRPMSSQLSSSIPIEEDRILAKEVSRVFFSNLEIVMALGEHYRFRTFFYWQPTVFEKETLSDHEKSARGAMEDVRPFFQMTNSVIREQIREKGDLLPVWDISRIFFDIERTLFIDWCHVSEEGNDRIADRMAGDIVREIKENPEKMCHNREKYLTERQE
ncbi:MAG: SGNH/GDSL hydrolase family protein [Acidobacteria bacterium]|nr:SGNH/GDSL hydrolase family protein [Acidobacteriota bacterium]